MSLKTYDRRKSRNCLYLAATLLVGLGVFIPAGCSNSPYPQDDANSKTLYKDITGEVEYLDPARTYGLGGDILACICESPFQYHYVDRPYKLDPLLALEVPKPEQRKIVYKGKEINATVYTIRLMKGVMYQNHPCFVESNRRLSEKDLVGIKGVNDFKKTATREMTAADIVNGVRRTADYRLEFPGTSAFVPNLLGYSDYFESIRSRLKQERVKRRAAAGMLYNEELDEQYNPIKIDYSKDNEYPFIREVDRYSFEIVLSHPYPQILYWMTFPFFAPVPPEALEFYEQPGMLKRGILFNINPVGTGPYKLTTFDPVCQIILDRNVNFHP